MKIYNSQAQRLTNMVAVTIATVIFIGKLNTSPQYAVQYYNWSQQFIKAVLVGSCIWIPCTFFCSLTTMKLKNKRK